MSHLKTINTGILPLKRCYIELTAKEDADNIPIHGSTSSTYLSVDYMYPQDFLVIYE